MDQLTAPRAPITISILGTTYTLKWSLLARYLMSQRWGQSGQGPGGNISRCLDLFAFAVAHNFQEQGKSILTPEQWAAIIPDEQWNEVCRVTAQLDAQIAAERAKMMPAADLAQAQPAATAQPN